MPLGDRRALLQDQLQPAEELQLLEPESKMLRPDHPPGSQLVDPGISALPLGSADAASANLEEPPGRLPQHMAADGALLRVPARFSTSSSFRFNSWPPLPRPPSP